MAAKRPAGVMPPANIRYLAAAAHVGFWGGFLLLFVIAEIVSVSLPFEIPSWVPMAMLLVYTFGPGAAALAKSQRSPWRGFLVCHGGRALLVHAVAGLVMLAANRQGGGDLTIPEPVGWFIGILLLVLGLLWFVLPFGAAFRALEGSPPWYPLLGRLIPDPPSGSAAPEPTPGAHGTDLHH